MFGGLLEGIGVWEEKEPNAYQLVRVLRPEDAIQPSGERVTALRDNELIRPDYIGKTGVSNSDAQVLWDAGISMTMPGEREDIYLWADRATIEQIVGQIADSALHPEQNKAGAIRVMRTRDEPSE